MKEEPIQAIICFLFDEAGNLLLLKRKDNNKWEPVKGVIENGEKPEEAFRRELFEETALEDTRSLEFLYEDDEIIENKKEGTKKHIHFYAFRASVEKVKPDITINNEEDMDHQAYQWITVEEAQKINLYPPSANYALKKIAGNT